MKYIGDLLKLLWKGFRKDEFGKSLEGTDHFIFISPSVYLTFTKHFPVIL